MKAVYLSNIFHCKIQWMLLLSFVIRSYFCATCNFISGVLCQKHPTYTVGCNGPLGRYVKLRLTHVPGMPGTFSPPPTSKETASKRSRHASRHVRGTRAVMHVGIANPRGGEDVPGIPGACVTRNFMHLARGPLPDRALDTCCRHNTHHISSILFT